MSGDENLWYVKTPDGDVHRVTLDQLDEAFQAGRIDSKVMVLAAGSTQWSSLGALAGLDEPAPPPASVSPNTMRPVSMDLTADLDEDVFTKKPRRGLMIGAVVGVLAVAGAIFAVSGGHGSDATTAAASQPPPAPVTPAAAPDPVTPPQATAPSDPAIKLSDDQRARLSAADKALDAKIKAKKKGREDLQLHATRHTKYRSQGFTTGGSKFDPLNASP